MSGSSATPADQLTRFVFEHGAVRGELVNLGSAYQDVLRCHPYPPVVAVLLGELLAATVLLAATLKFNGSLILQLRGDGPISLLVIECDHALRFRATAQWRAEETAQLQAINIATRPALKQLTGGGRMALTLDPKDGGPMYQGIVALDASSVASAFEHYLKTSEQIDSRLALRADGETASGILVQRLPGSRESEDGLWDRAGEAVSGLAWLVPTQPEALLGFLFPNDEVRMFAPQAPQFFCSCSVDRVDNALRAMGQAESEAILREQGSIEVTCEFCNRHYRLGEADVERVFKAADVASSTVQSALNK